MKHIHVQYIPVQASWEKRLIDRVYNVCKGEKRKHDDQGASTSSKKPKITDRYPPLSLVEVCDDVTDTRNIGALEKELNRLAAVMISHVVPPTAEAFFN